MKIRCIRYHRSHQVESGFVHTNTIGYVDTETPKAFTDLINAIPNHTGERNAEGDMINAKWIPKIGDEFILFEEPIAVAILKCVKTINEQIQNAYNKGKEDGKNILIQLNNGDISMSDFNK